MKSQVVVVTFQTHRHDFFIDRRSISVQLVHFYDWKYFSQTRKTKRSRINPGITFTLNWFNCPLRLGERGYPTPTLFSYVTYFESVSRTTLTCVCVCVQSLHPNSHKHMIKKELKVCHKKSKHKNINPQKLNLNYINLYIKFKMQKFIKIE